MVSKGARLAVLVSLVCVARSFCQEPPPHEPPPPHERKPSQWAGELSLGFAPTFFHATYGDSGEDGDYWINGFAFSFDYRAVYKPNGFCFAVKMVIGGVGADMDIPSGYDAAGFTFDMGDLDGWDYWASYTIGKQFEHDIFTFTPTVGLGASWFFLEGDGQVGYSGYTYYFDYDVSGYQVALCADFAFGIMFSDNVGISASLLMACSLFGSVSESVDIQDMGSASEDYDLDFGCFSCIPSFYLTIRF